MKNKSMAQYLITVSSELTEQEVVAEFDPLIMDRVSLFISNIMGRKVEFVVDMIDLVAVESLEE